VTSTPRDRRPRSIPRPPNIGDLVSKEVYDELLIDEEKHIDFLETQLELINQLGVQLSQKHIGRLEDSK